MLSDDEIVEAASEAKLMFKFGYDNYMKHAYPLDELNPVYCSGRGPDYEDPNNLNINDVLGNYSLTLIDSLTTLVVMNEKALFFDAVKKIIEVVDFNQSVNVQVFEVTIRVIGSLLSTHLLVTGENKWVGDWTLEGYNGELLSKAQFLANRLMPAFENTKTGISYPRVNLAKGVLVGTINETCTAGATSLIVEFGLLSRITGIDKYEKFAKRNIEKVWTSRSVKTNLLGNTINIQDGRWTGFLSGIGAGIDSFYEYLLKAYIIFNEEQYMSIYEKATKALKSHNRRGRKECFEGDDNVPMYVNVDMRTGETINNWVDALQASYAGVLVLAGDVEEAICQHALYYSIWKKYGMIPERFNYKSKAPDVSFYLLRPEFVESTYLLYQATKSPFYLSVGREIMDSINLNCRVACGFASVHDVLEKTVEDRMESFFLSETVKYLYLLFDISNPVNLNAGKLIFSTEGHMFPLLTKFQTPSVTQKMKGIENRYCNETKAMEFDGFPLPVNKLMDYFKFVDL
uniref:Alpha-1,2-Mannosidase n=1 Tax=Rhabditophanes sp. KR3021 TaxID=114890 RepID=A0AC35TLB5_9BILA